MTHQAEREDDVVIWLRGFARQYRVRGRMPDLIVWGAIREMVDDYEAHADAGTPLIEREYKGD